MTPDDFFNIKSDLKPGAVPRGDDSYNSSRRPTVQPNTNKNFKKILDRDEDRHSKNVNDKAQAAPKEKEHPEKKNGADSDKDLKEAKTKETKQPELDPRFNQVPTIAKDTKVAPKMGKGITEAPAEEPRAMPYIDPMELAERGKDAAGKVAGGESDIVKAMAMEKEKMQQPKDAKPELPTMAKGEGLAKKDSKVGDGKDANDEAPLISSADIGNMGNQQQTGNIAVGPLPAAAGQGAAAAQQMQDLINKIADHLSVTATAHQTDTSITINNLPLFEGTIVTVHSFPTARGEINVTFENLTQQAKNVLDMVDNRTALQQALDQKGYTVHMITTTTTVIERPHTEASGLHREGHGGASDDDQPNRERQQQDEEQPNEE